MGPGLHGAWPAWGTACMGRGLHGAWPAWGLACKGPGLHLHGAWPANGVPAEAKLMMMTMMMMMTINTILAHAGNLVHLKITFRVSFI